MLSDVSVRASFDLPAAPTAVVQPPTTQETPQVEAPMDNLTPTAVSEGLNGYQIALVVIIVVFFVVFIGLLSVIIMQRSAIKRMGGGGVSFD